MNLFTSLKTKIIRPDFFQNRPLALRNGLKFYSWLILLFVLGKMITLLPDGVVFVRAMFSDSFTKQQTLVSSLYPTELELTVKNGQISSNVAEPYPIAFPEAWQSKEHVLPNKNLVVIHTSKAIDTADFTSQDTLFILGQNGFGYHDPSKGEFRVYDLSQQGWRGNFTLTHDDFVQIVAKVGIAFKWIVLIGCVLLPFLLYGTLFVGYLLYLIAGAGIVWLGAKLHGHELRYGQAYIAGLFLLPVPFLYDFITGVLFTGPHTILPFAFTLILLIMTLLNFPKHSSGSLLPVAATETTLVESHPGEKIVSPVSKKTEDGK